MGIGMRDREQELLNRHYGRQASRMASYDLATRTLYVAQEAHSVDMALAIATGAIPDIGFVAMGDRCWWQVAFLSQPTMRPVTIGMQWPAHDRLLLAIARAKHFVLQVEGTLPVDIRIPQAYPTLRDWLAAKGWDA